MRNLGLILVSILLGAAGQLLMKKGMMEYGREVGATTIWTQLFAILLRPSIVIGVICFVVSFVLWLAVMSKNEISYAYPMVSISYVIILFVSAYWFNENVTLVRMLGVALILSGVVAITRT